jgi:putative FmdB family regulatory protein
MPIYEYQCQSCGKRTERLQSMTGPPLASCPACGGEVKKLVSAPAVQFKGSGWYVTDYAGKGKGGESKSESKGESKADSKSESKSESKSDSKSESKSESKGESKAESKSESKASSD